MATPLNIKNIQASAVARPVLRHGSKGGMTQMEWTKPEFVEVSMDAEIGRYQQDDDGRP